MTRKPYLEFWPAASVAMGSAVLFVVAVNAGWPGAPDPCIAAGDCFCEAPRPGWVRQPSNTWSNLAFVLVGLAIAWHAARGPRNGANGVQGNRMTRGGMYPALYAAIVVFMGPGSMYFHAGLTRWGGTLDALSMYLFIGFVISYAIARGWRLSRRGFLLWFVGINLAVGAPQVLLATPPTLPFAALVTVAFALEGLLMRRGGGGAPWLPKPAPIRARWIMAGTASFFLALGIWILSRTGGPLCDPNSLWQGHAAWHILSAGTTACLYVYWRSEDRPRS